MAGAIYSETVSFYRGTAYLVFAGFMTVALLLFLWVCMKVVLEYILPSKLTVVILQQFDVTYYSFLVVFLKYM